MLFWRKKEFAARKSLSLRGVPRDLSPHLMRDIGLEPWPNDLRILHYLLPRSKS